MLSAHARHVWVTACWVGAVAATALNGVVVGYGVVWFQLFGETADAEDYLVSAGGYGAAAVVLVLAVPGILTHRGPRWLAWAAGASAAVLGSARYGFARSVHARGAVRLTRQHRLGRDRCCDVGAVDVGARRAGDPGAPPPRADQPHRSLNQTDVLEHLEVLRHRRLAGRQRPGQSLTVRSPAASSIRIERRFGSTVLRTGSATDRSDGGTGDAHQVGGGEAEVEAAAATGDVDLVEGHRALVQHGRVRPLLAHRGDARRRRTRWRARRRRGRPSRPCCRPPPLRAP